MPHVGGVPIIAQVYFAQFLPAGIAVGIVDKGQIRGVPKAIQVALHIMGVPPFVEKELGIENLSRGPILVGWGGWRRRNRIKIPGVSKGTEENQGKRYAQSSDGSAERHNKKP
jgi:hypothetical protein